jgi:hypothetical protein
MLPIQNSKNESVTKSSDVIHGIAITIALRRMDELYGQRVTDLVANYSSSHSNAGASSTIPLAPFPHPSRFFVDCHKHPISFALYSANFNSGNIAS